MKRHATRSNMSPAGAPATTTMRLSLRANGSRLSRRTSTEEDEDMIPRYNPPSPESSTEGKKRRRNEQGALVRLYRYHLQSSLPNAILLIVVAVGFFVQILRFLFGSHQSHSGIFRRCPIMIQAVSTRDVVPLPSSQQPVPWIKDRHNHYWLDHGVSTHDMVRDPPEECSALESWQDDRSNLNCNALHDVDLVTNFLEIDVVGSGGFMLVLSIPEYTTGKSHPLAVKVLMWDDELNYDHIGMTDARMDAMASAQLQASPYILNTYGYCAQAQITEYANGGMLWWLFDEYEPSRDDLFQIALNVARAVHDAQHVDSNGKPTIAHLDIKANQFLLKDGMYKLNDFNLCDFLRWNTTSQQYCEFESGYEGRWQAPEQAIEGYRHKDERADTFSLGYVLYFLLTRKKPFEGTEGDKVQKQVLNGQLPEISEEIRKSTHPFDIAMISIIDKCLKVDPMKRPTSKQVVNFLANALAQAGLEPMPIRILAKENS